jgi:hypothetical protein
VLRLCRLRQLARDRPLGRRRVGGAVEKKRSGSTEDGDAGIGLTSADRSTTSSSWMQDSQTFDRFRRAAGGVPPRAAAAGSGGPGPPSERAAIFQIKAGSMASPTSLDLVLERRRAELTPGRRPVPTRPRDDQTHHGGRCSLLLVPRGVSYFDALTESLRPRAVALRRARYLATGDYRRTGAPGPGEDVAALALRSPHTPFTKELERLAVWRTSRSRSTGWSARTTATDSCGLRAS